MQNNNFLGEKRRSYIEYIFMAFFLLYAVLSSNSITYGKSIITPIMWVSFALSLLVLCYRLINYKLYLKIPETLILFFLIFSIGISTLINYNYSFKRNVIFCIYWVIYFLVLFTTEKNKTKESCKKDIKFISVIFVVYTTVAVIASLVLYAMNVSITTVIEDSGYTYNLGFVWGRLWGVFINPNNGAISSAISIIILAYVFIRNKRFWARILSALDVIMHLLYIVFSDSRSGAIVLSVSVAVFVLCAISITIKDKKLLLKGASFALAACIGISCFLGMRYLRTPVNNIINIAASQFSDNDKDSDIDKDNDNDNDNDKHSNIIDRGYDLSDDISNRRFDVWKSGLEVYLNSPKNMLVGLSFCGFTDYARENMPQTYIVNNDFADMTTLDNEVVNILVSNGGIGLLCALALVIYVLVCIFKNFRYVNRSDKYFSALVISIPVALASAAMFSSLMFYHFSPNAIIFWFVLGRCLAFLKSNKECSA